MDFLNFALATKPTGLWPTLIFGIDKGIGNYIWTIIIVTLLIKLVLLPFEFLQQRSTKAITRMNATLQPKMDAIKKQYASNPQMMNQKLSELQRKEGGAMGGSCIGMLLYMVLNLVIFFTFCGSMTSISRYMISTQYDKLSNTYDSVYETVINENSSTLEGEALENNAKESAQNAVLKEYKDTQVSFLWIKSIWQPDNNTSPVLSYKSYLSSSGTKADQLSEERYNLVMSKVTEEYKGTWNGYYILPILSAVILFISSQTSMWIAKWFAKKRGTVYNNPSNNKLMNLLLPLMMAMFTLFYNAGFAIYIVASGLFGLLFTPLLSLLTEYLQYKKAKKNAPITVSYSRDNLKK